ncbi:MAG: hypothetical protein O2840_02315 [bacterium]|nr:hypothetical protein [bacterium]
MTRSTAFPKLGLADSHTEGEELDIEKQERTFKMASTIKESLIWLLSLKNSYPNAFFFYAEQFLLRTQEVGLVNETTWKSLTEEMMSRLAASLQWLRNQVSYSRLKLPDRESSTVPELLTEISVYLGKGERAKIDWSVNPFFQTALNELEVSDPKLAREVHEMMRFLSKVNNTTPEFHNFKPVPESEEDSKPAKALPKLEISPATQAMAKALIECNVLAEAISRLYLFEGNRLLHMQILSGIGAEGERIIAFLYIRSIRRLLILSGRDPSDIDNRLIEVGVHLDFQAAVTTYSDPSDALALAQSRQVLQQIIG